MKTTRLAQESYSRLRQVVPDDAQFEATKLLCHTQTLSKWLRGDAVVPITLELDVSLACNDRCPRCVHAFAHANRFLALPDVKSILHEAAAVGVQGLTMSGGGEPLSHPSIREILAEIRHQPLTAGLISNGGLVRSESLATALVETFSWIRISLDAASERQYRFVRGIRGLKTRLECLERLARARQLTGSNCELGISFLTSASVAEDIPTAAKLARDLGFDYVQFKPKIYWSQDQHHRSVGLSQSGVFDAISDSMAGETRDFRVLMSGKKYAPEALGDDVFYSQFHSAWFIAAVGPSATGASVTPTLYLDCSAKYLPRWTVAPFQSFTRVLASPARRAAIEGTPSSRYCIPAEKHTSYNVQLESLLARHRRVPFSEAELSSLAPKQAKHIFSL